MMMNSKHTPKPMPKVRYSHVEGCFIAEGYGSHVNDRIDHGEIAHRCNIHPDLLTALDEMIGEFDNMADEWCRENGPNCHFPDTVGVEWARAAIAKAKGETKGK